MKAVKKHTESKWIILYIERWLKAPMQIADGTLQERIKGVPQGGVISPVLSNLFLHYVADKWINKKHQTIKWCRYADDGARQMPHLKPVEVRSWELTIDPGSTSTRMIG